MHFSFKKIGPRLLFAAVVNGVARLVQSKSAST